VVAIGQGAWMLAFLLFVAAGVSDAADGIIARRFHLRSELGAYLDPLADKALLVSIYVTLSVVGTVPGWLAIIVVSRDAMIVAAILVSRLMDKPVAIKPLLISKANTAAQIAFAAGVLGALAFGLPLGDWLALGMLAVAGLTGLSAAAYLARWLRHMAD
jgi:cardiolipin synthase